jgi:hypothetical protein
MVPPAVLALEPVAVFTHDYDSTSPLRSWPPVPAEQLHQGEMLAVKMFGSLLDDIRSPRHIYFASWRDPDPAGYPEEERGKPPTAILFVAQFGVAPYETTPSLLETAEMFNRLDRAQLRLYLVRGDDGAFRLDALQVELNAPASKTDRHFRSCWKGEELKGLDLSLQFDPPTSRLDPFRFHLRARLPRRYNHGAAIEREHVEFTASGGAMPLPRWVNY